MNGIDLRRLSHARGTNVVLQARANLIADCILAADRGEFSVDTSLRFDGDQSLYSDVLKDVATLLSHYGIYVFHCNEYKITATW